VFCALHATPLGHAPQFATVRETPQLSAAVFVPHSAPKRVQNTAFDSGVHPHTFGAPGLPPPQVCPVPLHPPQFATERALPQLSVPLVLPHCTPSLEQKLDSLSGVHPHTFGVPAPPQVTPMPLHVPQSNVPPQPSPTLSQFAPRAAHVLGVQPHTFTTPPPAQVCGAVQVPHATLLRRLPQLSAALMVPQSFP
jgi:hypothetical protein